MVGVDCNFLSLILHPEAKAPDDPSTKQPIERLRERIESLLQQLDEEEERILVPMPVLAEFLILAGNDGPEYLERLGQAKTFVLAPFDEKAAIELAAMELEDRARGDKRGGVKAPWQKIKVDRQVVAIARVYNAHTLYVDDQDAKSLARRAGMRVVSSWELYLPPSDTPLFDNVPDVADASPAETEEPLLRLMPPASEGSSEKL